MVHAVCIASLRGLGALVGEAAVTVATRLRFRQISRKSKAMPTIFVSHSSAAKDLAITFKSILIRGASDLQIFLSSDWDSIRAGSNWLQEIENALATHTHFIALVTRVEESKLPWICYEVGFARGRGLYPKVFVFGGIECKEIPFPIAGIQFVGTWDTNRWKMELLAMGVADIEGKEAELAVLFRQKS